ncbi:MAG: hypothetical protein Ct9H300mP22_5750 [Gammaproteobacteria bacterium]|nr:MAG: hypothetical protein Ct9H300mP22_5750 [Gammaproteobacteria bacterium]
MKLVSALSASLVLTLAAAQAIADTSIFFMVIVSPTAGDQVPVTTC